MATSNQDFSGLLGDIFGGGGGTTGLEEYLTAAQTGQMNRQALLQAAIAASQASAPSTTPKSFMQILGAGLAGGQQGYAQAQEGAMKQLITKQKLDEYKRQVANEQAYQDMLSQYGSSTGGTVTPMQAAAMPGMALGPTNERAAMIGQPMQATMPAQGGTSSLTPAQINLLKGMTAKEGRAELLKMLQPAEVVGEPYRASDGKVYQRTKTGGRIEVPSAEAPAVEPIGDIKEVTDATGNPVLIQRYKDGSIKTVDGFGVPRELVQVNLNGKIIFADKNKMPANATYLVGMSPAEEARLKIDKQNLAIAQQRLNISKADFERGQYDRMENEDGVFYVPKVPGLPAIPVSGPGGVALKGKAPPKPTEGEANAAGFAQQMENATAVINTLPAGSQPGAGSGVAGSVPFIGETVKRGVQPAATQQYEQAAQPWIRAKLRKESGAAIGVDEMNQEYRTYFPQINDTPDVIAQKANARAIATESMKRAAGKSYTPPPEIPKPAAAGIAEGTESKSKSGKPIVYRNGNWEYK